MAGFNLAQKRNARDAIIKSWTMTTMTKGKRINDSISEHKCIVTSNIIYSITVIIPINNNCSSVFVTRLLYKYLQSYGIPSSSFTS